MERLKADLDRLREELAALEVGDDAARQRLQDIASRIEAELDEAQELNDPAGLVDELKEAMSRFEAEYPTVAAVVNNLVVLLGGMGV